ncbi:hypothetical protein DL93DRAFT_2054597 [Clavulina sp. PMI_390]|nr:hypothetical protein DL93DRAFT_2054597 [Clavulina sp. PMI_390]
MPKQRATPRIVCCAIPIARAAGQLLLVTSRKKPESWVFPKGGFEDSDQKFEVAAAREALEEAGVRGVVSRYVTTIPTPTAIYHVYEMDVTSLDDQWLEAKERRREWVNYATAMARLQWKPELAQALSMSSLAPRR